jgi:hypothetical protein
MEDFIGRGDRRIGTVIKRAWELGALNDAWWESEQRAAATWSQVRVAAKAGRGVAAGPGGGPAAAAARQAGVRWEWEASSRQQGARAAVRISRNGSGSGSGWWRLHQARRRSPARPLPPPNTPADSAGHCGERADVEVPPGGRRRVGRARGAGR